MHVRAPSSKAGPSAISVKTHLFEKFANDSQSVFLLAGIA